MDGFGGGLASEFLGALAAVVIIIGALECYFGYRIFKIQLIIVGFLFGVLVGVAVVGAAMSAGIGAGILSGVLLGVLFAYLSVKVYFLGLFIFITAFAGAAAFLLTKGEQPVLSVAVAIVVGVIGTIVGKHLIIISTALSGGIAVGMGFMSMLDMGLGVALLLAAVSAGTGLYVQYKADAAKRQTGQPASPAVPDPQAGSKPSFKLPDLSSLKPKLHSVSEEQETSQVPGRGGMQCPVCGKALPYAASFCSGCGYDIKHTESVVSAPAYSVSSKTCSACGKMLPTNADFCGACGRRLDQ